MSLQVAILKVLSGHSNGHATSIAMQRDLAILAASGTEWSDRMRQLAERAPGLDIFTEGFVSRDATGWQLTNLGRNFLTSIEAATHHSSPVRSLLQAYALSNVVNLKKRRQVRNSRQASNLPVKAAGLRATSVEPLLYHRAQPHGGSTSRNAIRAAEPDPT